MPTLAKQTTTLLTEWSVVTLTIKISLSGSSLDLDAEKEQKHVKVNTADLDHVDNSIELRHSQSEQTQQP